jgi:hypothetical protein
MKTLTEIKVRVVPREFGHNQLTEAQKVLAKGLAEQSIYGGFSRTRLANILKEEMRFTARRTGGQTQEEIDTLLNGIDIAFGEEEKEDQG